MKGSVLDKLDPELKTYYLQVKDEVKKDHTNYISKHPEVRQLLNDFLSTVLLEKPDDVYTFAQDYFSYFNVEKEAPQYSPLVLSGPSQTAIAALVGVLLKNFPDLFELNTCYTSRSSDVPENEKRHYHFTTREEFTAEVTKHSFIEYSERDGALYGTHKEVVKKIAESGKICIIVGVDLKGVENIAKSGVKCNFVWIEPSTANALIEQLTKDGLSQEEAAKKAEKAEVEMKEAQSSKLFEKIIVNEDQQTTLAKLVEALNEIYSGVDLKLSS